MNSLGRIAGYLASYPLDKARGRYIQAADELLPHLSTSPLSAYMRANGITFEDMPHTTNGVARISPQGNRVVGMGTPQWVGERPQYPIIAHEIAHHELGHVGERRHMSPEEITFLTPYREVEAETAAMLMTKRALENIGANPYLSVRRSAPYIRHHLERIDPDYHLDFINESMGKGLELRKQILG